MNDIPQDELLSAYLDNELAPEERAEVERMLEENPASRQLLEELKSLRTAVQSLPRESLGQDFSKQVMQMAERSVLAGNSQSDGVAPAASPQTSRGENKIDIRRDGQGDWRQRMIRPLAFASLAIAAALMLMILQPEQLGEQSPSGNIARDERALESPASSIGPASSVDSAKDDSSLTDPTATERRATLSRKGDSGVRMEATTEAIPPEAPAPTNGVGFGLEMETTRSAVAPGLETRTFNAARSKEILEEQRQYQSNAAAPLFSIQLDVTPDAARSKTLDATLQRNGIKITSNAFGGGGTPADEAVEAEITPAVAPIDVVYVELTQSQLESVLTDIADQPVSFSNIMVPGNPAFAGQQPDSDDASNTAAQRAMPAERGQVAAPTGLGGAAESAATPTGPEGVAQRFQLPQLSDALSAGKKSQSKEQAEPSDTDGASPSEEELAEISAADRETDAEGKASPERSPTDEQMFRALFIQRVVPSTKTITTDSEPDTTEEPVPSKEPGSEDE